MKRIGSTAQRLKQLPYEKRVCRTEYHTHVLNPHSGDDEVAGPTIEEEIEGWVEAGLEVWVVSGEVDRGTPLWPSRIMETHPDADPDRISRFIDLCHEHGIIVLSYYPFTFTKKLVDIHPEWMIQMLDDGLPEIWNEGWFCVNSPYRDWLPEYLIEMFDHLDFDGIYFDDTNWGSHSGTQRPTVGCCCKYCQDLYLEETGSQLPSKVDLDSMEFRRFVNWRYDKWLEGIEHVTQKVHAKYPHAIIDWYNYGGCARQTPDMCWTMGHPLNPVNGSSYFFSRLASIENPTFAAKRFKAAAPTFGFWMCQRPMLPECETHSAPYPAPYSQLVCGLTTVAHGGAAIAPFLRAGEHTAFGDAAKSIFTELKKLRPYVGDKSFRYLALHFSQQTKDFGYYKEADNFWRQMRGSCEMLTRSQILTDIVFDQQLTYDHLSSYRMLMLSDSRCLADKEVEEITRYVSEGGTLLATYETSLYDEMGQRRENFALAELFGMDYRSSPAVPDEETVAVDPAQGNLYVPQEESLREQLGYIVAFAAKQTEVSARPDSQIEVPFTKSSLEHRDGRPPLDHFYARGDYDSGLPAVTVNSFGKGKAIYVCGDVGGGYDRNPLPQLKRFLTCLANMGAPPIEVEAPGVIEVTATWRSPKEVSIHLLNNPWPFMPWRPGQEHQEIRQMFERCLFIKEVVPVPGVTITVDGLEVKSASLPLQGKELPVDGEPLRIVLPNVGIQEILLLQLA